MVDWRFGIFGCAGGGCLVWCVGALWAFDMMVEWWRFGNGGMIRGEGKEDSKRDGGGKT